ncbi:sortase-dependent protein [Streptomyces sp. 378]|uniref:sortase-dependent protein n=1 Tax=Streptomyces sp. 378 TaxID=3049412 RepID=UPI0024C3A4F7|nr:sortase-dependent protein [Streptomyces sp. 378]MDK1342147.1 sortase-dependent protein [Streptomyces sp. 378]
MRRTVLSALALTATAVLMGTGPAFADGATTPSPVPSPAAPTTQPAESAEPTREAAPTPAPAEDEPTRTAAPTPAPAEDEPTRAPADDQVSVRPSGAPDTGVTAASPASGSDGTAIGAGAAAVLALGGGTVFVVRRRRATGA